MENFNPYEELNRTRKAAKIAMRLARCGYMLNGIEDTPDVRRNIVNVAVEVLRLPEPSDETLDIVLALVNERDLPGTPSV